MSPRDAEYIEVTSVCYRALTKIAECAAMRTRQDVIFAGHVADVIHNLPDALRGADDLMDRENH